MSSLPLSSTSPRKARNPDGPTTLAQRCAGRAWQTSAVRARWPRRHALAAGLRAGRGLPAVTVPRRVLAAVPLPSVAGWAGRGVGNDVAASPVGLWLAASRRGARDIPTQERAAGVRGGQPRDPPARAVSSPGIHRRRGAGAGAARKRVGDGAARGDLGTPE
jgi:hypothetical protein